MKKWYDNTLKIQIFSKTRFDVLYNGYIFVCTYNFDLGFWELRELWGFLEDVELMPYKCCSRLDCLHCLGWFYGKQ